MSERQDFCCQSRSDSCVAACCAMLLHHRAPPPLEHIQATHDRLYAEFPCLLSHMATGIGAAFQCVDIDSDLSFEELEFVVQRTWTAVLVLGGPWTEDLLRRRKDLKQPHGRLGLRTRHAVVLRHWDSHRILAHDPWFDPRDQPIAIDPAWRRRAWTGDYACFWPTEPSRP